MLLGRGELNGILMQIEVVARRELGGVQVREMHGKLQKCGKWLRREQLIEMLTLWGVSVLECLFIVPFFAMTPDQFGQIGHVYVNCILGAEGRCSRWIAFVVSTLVFSDKSRLKLRNAFRGVIGVIEWLRCYLFSMIGFDSVLTGMLDLKWYIHNKFALTFVIISASILQELKECVFFRQPPRV